MPKRPAIVRLLDACVDRDETRAVRILDSMTPWRGIPEVAADLAGPALVRLMVAQIDEGADALAEGLDQVAARLRSRR